MNKEIVLLIVMNIILTAGAYLFVPVIICFWGKKQTAKQIKRIVFINGAIVWFIFALIRAENNIQGSGASVFLWSAVAHWIIKANCLKEENTTAPNQSKGNYCITSEEVYLDLSNTENGEVPKIQQKNASQNGAQSKTESNNKSIPNATQYNSNPQLVCRKCGRILFEETVFCPHCGKRIRKKKFPFVVKLLLWILGIFTAIGLVLAVIFGIQQNKINKLYNNTLSAIENESFTLAQKYLQQIDNYEVLFPEETAYIDAAVLWEQGKNIEALKAFKKIRPEVPESIIEEVSDEIYRDAKAYYASGAYSQAKNYFTEIKNFENSGKYLTLISARNTESALRYSNLIEIFYFEDAQEIIQESDFYLTTFLIGRWKSADGSYHFEMEDGDDFTVSCNLPRKGTGKYYEIDDGRYKLGNNEEYIDCYKFTIVDRDTINIYCYKNEKTYTMNRQ